MDIFISYSREDSNFARELATILKSNGFAVFWDVDIDPGNKFRNKILKAITDSKCVVTIWSSSSVRSEWVVDESTIALEQGKLVPVIIDDVSPPMGFRQINASLLSNWDGSKDYGGIVKLIDAINWVSEHPNSDDETLRSGLDEYLEPIPRNKINMLESQLKRESLATTITRIMVGVVGLFLTLILLAFILSIWKDMDNISTRLTRMDDYMHDISNSLSNISKWQYDYSSKLTHIDESLGEISNNLENISKRQNDYSKRQSLHSTKK